MKRIKKISQLSAVAFFVGSFTANAADTWVNFAGLSPTATLEQNHLCYSDGRDVACGDRNIYVDSSGNVGIGIATPSSALQVNGTLRVGNGITDSLVTDISYWNATSHADLAALFSNTTAGALIEAPRYAHLVVGLKNNNNNDTFSVVSGGYPDIYTNDDTYDKLVLVAQANGKVGINGIKDPSTTLHIGGSLRISDGGETAVNAGAGAIKYDTGSLYFSDGSAWTALLDSSSISVDRIVSDTTSIVVNDVMDSISFTTAGTERMVITNDGKVGIGISQPPSTFSIYGTNWSTLSVQSTATTHSAITFITQGNGSTPLNNAGSKGWVMFGRGNGYTLDPEQQNDFGISYWDGDTSLHYNRLFIEHDTGYTGINTNTPSTTLDVSGTLKISNGGEAAADAGAGAIKYDTGSLYFSDGATWSALASTDNLVTELNDLTDAKYIGESVYVGVGAGNAVTVTTNLYNTSIGLNSLYSNTTGAGNVAFGSNALYANTTADANVALGNNSSYANTTGTENTAIGAGALFANTTGGENTATGRQALATNTTGGFNTGSGYRAGYFLSDGSTSNIAPSQSLYLGANTKALAYAGTNEIVIGYNTTGLGSNSVVLGNDSIITTALKGNIGIGTTTPVNKLHVRGKTTLQTTSLYGQPAANYDALDIWSGLYSFNQSSGLSIHNQNPENFAAQSLRLALKTDSGGIPRGSIDLIRRDSANIVLTNVEAISVISSGRVGINGITAPTASLHVSGTLRISNGGESAATVGSGAIKYDTGALYFSDGTNWIELISGSSAVTELNDLTDAKYLGQSVYVGSGAGNAVTVTTALYNTALGYQSLYSNTTGNYNTAVGQAALLLNTAGEGNTASGRAALNNNTTGSWNTASGRAALFFNTTGGWNTASGRAALYSNTEGSYNTASGSDAGRYITDGTTANATSNNSLYLGASTKALADGGDNEIVIGYDATGLGSNSVVLGNDSIVTTALKGNVGIGTTAPEYPLHVIGSASLGTGPSVTGILIKYWLDATDTDIDALLLGSTAGNVIQAPLNAHLVVGLQDNDIRDAFSIVSGGGNYTTDTTYDTLVMTARADGNIGIGIDDPSVALDISGSIEYTGTITDVSDRRLKTNIQPLNSTLADIAALEPVSFQMKDNLKETELGFIAQDVEKLFPLLVKTADDASQTKSLNYIGLIAPMVKAMQELKDENDALKAQLSTFEERLKALEAQ